MSDHQAGELRDIGEHNLGRDRYRYSRCAECRTEFPHLRHGPSCNGAAIARCPWCRPDSKPWTDGRGL